MTHLIFHDNKRREVSYGQAAEILAILNGEQEPKDEAQAEYVAGVKEVVIPPLPGAAKARRRSKEANKEVANKIREINRQYLVPSQKRFEMIGDVFREEFK